MPYDDLRYLAGGYFHQDYDVVSGSAEGALDEFTSDDLTQRRATLRDVTEALSRNLSEDGLRALWLDTCAGQYLPEDDGRTFRQWFEHIRDVISESLP